MADEWICDECGKPITDRTRAVEYGAAFLGEGPTPQVQRFHEDDCWTKWQKKRDESEPTEA
jgi:hypothetical protein